MDFVLKTLIIAFAEPYRHFLRTAASAAPVRKTVKVKRDTRKEEKERIDIGQIGFSAWTTTLKI